MSPTVIFAFCSSVCDVMATEGLRSKEDVFQSDCSALAIDDGVDSMYI